MMEEINYCVEILNLFENKKHKNSFIIEEITNRQYEALVTHLDNIKLEDNTIIKKEIYGSGYIGYFDIHWYQKKYKRYVDLLQKKVSSGNENDRYGYSFLDYIHRLQQLFINEKLDEKQMLEIILKIDRDIGKKHLFISLLKYMMEQKKWNEMQYYIEQMPIFNANDFQQKDEPTSAFGYQIRIYEFIENVNLKKFKEYYKKCMPSIHRNEMKIIKSDFIINYSKQKGVEETIELTKKSPFKNFEIDALSPQTNILSYPKILKLIDDHEEILNKQKSAIKEKLLVDTLKSNFNKGNYIEAYFLEVYKMIEKMNRKERWGDFKLKDILLHDLGRSTKNNLLITSCRKQIKHSILKQELKLWETENKNT